MAATTRRDYYEVLGVPRDADQKAIKDAFRALALRYHPDRSKEPGAEERFKQIAEAYAVLGDPKKRAEYDARGFAGVAGFSPEDLFGGVDFGDLFGGLGLGQGLFDRFFGGRRRTGPRAGANLEVEIAVPLERVVSGGEEMVDVLRAQPCPICQGSGAKPGTSPRRCEQCRGTGQEVVSQAERGVRLRTITTCRLCAGSGRVIDSPCTDCDGHGQVERHERIAVRLPKGVEEGMVLRVPGRGLPSRERGGVPGDLFVVIRTVADPRFERRGADLWRSETIEVVDAVLGSTLEVPTLEGPTKVQVRPGTQPGAILRLRGKGLPEFGHAGRGDLYLRLSVHVPERLSAGERDIYQQLRSGAQGSHRARHAKNESFADAGQEKR